jgi:indole-3-glycerol phosphate synthase
MQTILETIIAYKKKDLAIRKVSIPLIKVIDKANQTPLPAFSFYKALLKPTPNKIHIIAEAKKASPSKGIICEYFRPLTISRSYYRAGVSAISVLTEERFFMGKDAYLKNVASQIPLPVLRKDFIIDPYQVYESRALGAAAFLLIVDCLFPDQLTKLIALGRKLGMTALVEAHREHEIGIAIECGAKVIGINNRNLRTFKTSLDNTLKLRALIPPDIAAVSESGINNRQDIATLIDNKVNAVLIGEALMRQTGSIGKKIKELLPL